ncbi:hypothetical protein [Bifidobacterium sp. ESL0764]|uniref:hypothetical protein n=1 Tax=Bifidobacterium sp. ESL0764 TaxID=2983228 RepID=UPI0023F99649|nr:hypothetical protein [Bifidobacterium sp. ESL0764]WEV65593.1 hypothetical protein OZX71_07560 [Bifidobacterium sp. ESL0764]
MTSQQDKKNKRNAKPTRHAVIMRGVVAPIFGLLAVLFIVLGTLNMTVWKPAREVSATTSVSGTRYVVTDSGMLNLLAKSVDVEVSTHGDRAKAASRSDKTKTAKSSARTCVALGNAKDAAGWLAGQQYVRVTGLDGWKALSTKTDTGSRIDTSKSGDEVAFKDSDMWTSVKCGDSAIKLNLNDVRSDQVMVVDMGATPKKSAKPSAIITMHWVRDQVPNHALPFFVAAGVCGVLTILSASIFAIMANESFKRKRAKRREEREKAKAEEVSISEAMTGSIAVLRTSLTHSSHNHRPSHKIRPSDIGASDEASRAEGGADAASGEGSLLSGTSETGLSAPSIIDPTRRNLVADMQMKNDTDGNDDSTDNVDDADADGNDDKTETARPQSSEPERSGEGETVAGTDSEHLAEGAKAVDSDEKNHGVKRSGRHCGKPEQETESDAAATPAHVGRHARHTTASRVDDSSAGNLNNGNNTDGRKKETTDFRDANVSVSLQQSAGNAGSDNAEHSDARNGEGRTASSADELIDEGHAQAETTVISMSDLRAYFARLSSETSETSETSNGEADAANATSKQTSETPTVNEDEKNV